MFSVCQLDENDVIVIVIVSVCQLDENDVIVCPIALLGRGPVPEGLETQV